MLSADKEEREFYEDKSL